MPMVLMRLLLWGIYCALLAVPHVGVAADEGRAGGLSRRLNPTSPVLNINVHQDAAVYTPAPASRLKIPLLQPESITLPEEEFWARMAQTHQLLRRGARTGSVSFAQQKSLLDEVRALWQGVETVRLADGSRLAVDMTWLSQIDDSVDINLLLARVGALLEYRETLLTGGAGNGVGGLSRGELDRLLNESRFQYQDEAPPEFENTPELNVPMLMSPVLAQLIFLAISIAVVVAALFFLARGLDLSRAQLPTEQAEQDPTTASQARDLALESETVGDYRAAIRYLYLASLLMLDERGVIHYNPTLTNREHLRQVANNPQLHDLLRPVVQTFDHVWYGFAPVDEATYANFRAEVEQLRQITEGEKVKA